MPFKRGLKYSDELDENSDNFQKAMEKFESAHQKSIYRKFDKSDEEQARILKGTNDKLARKISVWAENGWVPASIAREANDDEWTPQTQGNDVRIEGDVVHDQSTEVEDVVHDQSTEVEDVVMKDSEIGKSSESSTSLQYCPSCGKDVSNNQNVSFCSECGYEF